MRSFRRQRTAVLCAVVMLAGVLLHSAVYSVEAARAPITVTNAVTGESKSANSLQEAFDIAERGCFVDVSQYITLDSDVTLSAEVWLRGETNITFGNYKILLKGNGALFVIERLRSKNIDVANGDHSWIEMVEENGGYLYYIKSHVPAFKNGAKPWLESSGVVYGHRVEERALDNGTAGYFYHDLAAAGITAGELSGLVAVDYGPGDKNAVWYTDAVVATFHSGTANLATGDIVPNGSRMVLTASNHDNTEKATKSYTVILLGDVNGNGRVDAADAHLIILHTNGSKLLTGDALLAADANQDGLVNRQDAALLCEKYVDPAGYSTPLV